MKILQSGVGAFMSNVIQQIRAGVTEVQGVGIFVTPANIVVEFEADIISDPQSLVEVTTTNTAKAGSVSTPEKTRTQTDDTGDTTTNNTLDTQTNDTTDTTTRSATTDNSSGGTNTDDATYTYNDET